MPAGDRTGPWGYGPRTGRGLGYCSGYARPGYMTAGPGWGLGRGFGRGRGMGRFFPFMSPWGAPYRGYPYPPPAPYAASSAGGYPPSVNEEEALSDEAAFLEAELDRIRERIGELKKTRETEAGSEPK